MQWACSSQPLPTPSAVAAAAAEATAAVSSLAFTSGLVPPLLGPLRLFHEAVTLSKAAVTMTFIRGASPPPASLCRHGCLPDSTRRMASTPAGVGSPHCRLRRRALRLLHAPHRRHITKGSGPSTFDRTCPLSAHWPASASPLSPGHVAALCFTVRSAPTAQVLQMAHRHLPASNLQ